MPPQNQYMAADNPKGLVAPGNLSIWNRPAVQNDDGSHSSEYSTSFQDDDGHEVLVPSVVGGKFLTPDGKKPPEGSPAEKAMFKAAWNHYKQTGEHLGKFDNPDNADAYAGVLHNRGTMPQQQGQYSAADVTPAPSGKFSSSDIDFPAGQSDSLLDKIGHGAEDVIYPSVGAAAGLALGGVGGSETGPGALLTALTGAGLGAGIGTELKRGMRAARGRSDLNPTGWGHLAETGTDMLSGPVQEFKGALKLAGPAIMGDIDKVSPKLAKMINDHIGLQSSDLAKWKRMMPDAPLKIGQTVAEEAGFNPKLKPQYDQITGALDDLTGKQEKLVKDASNRVALNHPSGQPVKYQPKANVDNILLNQAEELRHELARAGGLNEGTNAAVDLNRDTMRGTRAAPKTAEQLVQMRRDIKPSTFDHNTPNIEQRYRQNVYHAINDTVEQMLSPEDAAQFKSANQKIHNLIIAKDAAGEKLFKGNLVSPSPVKTAVKAAYPGNWGKLIPNAALNKAESVVLPNGGSALKRGLKAIPTRAGIGGAVVDGLQGDNDASEQ